MRDLLRRLRHRLSASTDLLQGALAIVAAIALLWTATGLHLRELHRQAVRSAEAESESLVRNLQQQTIRTIEAADNLLRFVQLDWRRQGAHLSIAEYAAAYRPADGIAVQLAIIGADGRLRLSSVDPNAAPVDLSDREHFRVHLGERPERLFISRPVLGRVSGRWTLQFTRPLRTADGAFDGVVVLSLDTGYLNNFLDSLRLGRASLALVGTDGTLRVRAPGNMRLGQSLPAWAMERLSQGEAGRYRAASAFDGVDRFYSYRALPEFGLIAVAGLDAAEAMQANDFSAGRTLIAAAGGSILVLLIGIVVLVQRRRIAQTRHALATTLARMTQGVVMADANGAVMVVNDRARDLLGLRPREGRAGMPVVDLLARLGPTAKGNPGLRERVTADGRTVESEVLPLPEGGLVLTCTDVTGQRAAAAAQEAALAAAEAANRAKSDFLANMSHEIRTPMNGVVGMIQVLRHSGLTPEQRRMCETVTRSANALLSVLNDILDYSKLEAGRITIEPLPCSVSDLVEDVAGLMRGAAEAKQVRLEVIRHADPPTVLLDPTRLRQILLNLLSNAVKFSDDGCITITLDSEPDPLDPERVNLRIAVRDEGIGIAPEALSRLFTRFTQADASSTRRFGGSGLGLAISQELAHIMGGNIAVWSEPEKGSEFTLRISAPRTVAAAMATEEAEDDLPPGPPATLDILVAEDDEVNRIVISAFLRPDGHRVTFAYNGVDAVLAARRSRFDIILMDVMMPGMDGPTATREIRGLPDEAAATPIIALTANAMAGDRERYLAAGMNAYVSKPINRRELYRTIETLLGMRAFARPEAPPPPPEDTVAPEVSEELDDILSGLGGLPGQAAAVTGAATAAAGGSAGGNTPHPPRS